MLKDDDLAWMKPPPAAADAYDAQIASDLDPKNAWVIAAHHAVERVNTRRASEAAAPVAAILAPSNERSVDWDDLSRTSSTWDPPQLKERGEKVATISRCHGNVLSESLKAFWRGSH